jgi:hypothetical protein
MKDLSIIVKLKWKPGQTTHAYVTALKNDIERLGISAKVYFYKYCRVRFETVEDLNLFKLAGIVKKSGMKAGAFHSIKSANKAYRYELK